MMKPKEKEKRGMLHRANVWKVRRVLAVLLVVAVVIGMLPVGGITVSASEVAEESNVSTTGEETASAAYQEAAWNESESKVSYTPKTADCTVVTGSTDAVTWDAGWYVVNSIVTISEPVTVSGEVHLILADGCTLNAEKGIVVTDGNSLAIYAQSGGSGTLNATGIVDDNYNASAGIGGSIASVDSGTIIIHGGVVNATGGGNSNCNGAAGIGGGAPQLRGWRKQRCSHYLRRRGYCQQRQG